MNTQRINDKLSHIYKSVITLLGSAKFSWFIIILFSIQALWVAWSFSWIMFDERFHFGIIQIYTHHWWPVIYDQPLTYDQYRDFAGEGSKLYHFLMSFPLRGIEFFTSDQIIQLRFLRIINVVMGAVGLWWFFRLFNLLKIRLIYSNIALLTFTLLPIVVWIGGAVNYDNFIFMLTPIIFYMFVRILQDFPTLYTPPLIIFLILGLTASLAKFTFIPVLFFMFVVLFIRFIREKRKDQHIKLASLAWLKKPLGILTVALLITLSFLFAQTYVVNVLHYGTPRPDCQKTLGVERCLSNSVIQRNEALLQERELTPRVDIVDYSYTWFETIHKTLFYSSRVEGKDTLPLPILNISFTVLFVLGIVASGVMIARNGIKNRHLGIILGLSFFYALLVLYEHYAIYMKYGAPLAIQGRYLLLIIPIIIVFMVQSVASIVQHGQKVYIGLACAVLLIVGTLQGGGILTHIIRSEPSAYWEGSYAQTVNGKAKQLLQRLINEQP